MIKPDMFSLTELFHSTFGEIGAVINYDAVWKTKTKDHLFRELNRHGCITLTDRLCRNPLCKFINRHQEVCLFIFRPLERSNHVKPPDCERPSNWNHAQLLSRHTSSS